MGDLTKSLSLVPGRPVLAIVAAGPGAGLVEQARSSLTGWEGLASGWRTAIQASTQSVKERARSKPIDAIRRRMSGRSMGAARMPGDDEIAQALVERARSGEAEAFAALFALHRDEIQRLCARMLDDAASAEDATGEVFLRARRALASFDPETPFRPWLRSVATNHCIDQLRRRKKERALFSAADLSHDDLADTAPGALARITRHQERHQVLEALDLLPAKYRLPLVLRFYQELDYAAIAEILDVTPNQVGTLLHRAKTRLRAALAESGTPEPKRGARRARRRDRTSPKTRNGRGAR